MPPKSMRAPVRIPEFERNIAQMDSDEALRFLDAVRAQVAKGKLSPKKLADLLGEYASAPRAPAVMNIPDDVMGVLASKLKPIDLARLTATSKEIKRQTESMHRVAAKATPLLYLPPKVLANVLHKVNMEDMSALKRTSRFASEQVENALAKRNPCMSDFARAILTLANWAHKKKVGQIRISLPNMTKSIKFPVVTNDGTFFPVDAGNRIQLQLGSTEFSYIDLPAKLDDATIRKFAAYLEATASDNRYTFPGSTTFELVWYGNYMLKSFTWIFGHPLVIPERMSENRDYVKMITSYAKTVNKCYHPDAPLIVSPTPSPSRSPPT